MASGPYVARARIRSLLVQNCRHHLAGGQTVQCRAHLVTRVATLVAWHDGDVSDETTDTAVKQAWLEPSWLFWEQVVESRSIFSSDALDRPYEIQQHACDRLAGNPSDLDRVDAITTLRRAVARRVRMLNEIYHLRKLPVTPKPKDDLHLLSSFDIMRPFMVKRLIDIRNIVEHQDSEPPPTNECLMFADLVWYFLRSTDGLVHGRVDDVFFYPPGVDPDSRKYHPSVRVTFPENFSMPPRIGAWLNMSSVSQEAKASWIRIDANEFAIHEGDEPRAGIIGKMLGTPEQMRLLYDAYFRNASF